MLGADEAQAMECDSGVEVRVWVCCLFCPPFQSPKIDLTSLSII